MKRQEIRTLRMCVSAIRFSVVILLVLLATMTGGCTQSRVRAVDIFDEVWTIVSEEFHDPNYGGVDWNSLRNRYRPEMESARGVEDCARIINTMLGELKTSHTGYYTPEETAYYGLLDIFNQGKFGEKIRKIFPGGVVHYSGIGIQTQLINGKRFVIDVPESSPAAEAGLKVGDEILGVRGASGRRSGGTSGGGGKLFHPVDSFRGRVGQKIQLTIRRFTGPGGERDVAVTPRMIVPGEMYLNSIRASAKVIERGQARIGYVRLRSYAGEQYHEALKELVLFEALSQADGLVLDIRGGWGGANPDYLNLFNHAVPVFTFIDRDANHRRFDTQWRKPVVLLVDQGSRSGKEVLAYGFQKYGIGKVVGSTTAGAVVGGRPFLLSDGSLLYLAVRDVLVDGERIEGVGVTPDVEVEFSIPYANGADPQLEKALDVLLDDIRMAR